MATKTEDPPAVATKRFGEYAVEAGIVEQGQVNECLKLQKRYKKAGKKVPKIGELLVHKGHITKDQVNEILKQARRAKRKKSAKSAKDDDAPKKSKAAKSASASKSSESSEAEATEKETEEQKPARSTRSAKPRLALPPGTIYAELLVEDRLEQRWIGDLFIARQESKDRPVSLLVIDPAKMVEKAFKTTLVDSMKAVAKLDHPNIQKLYTFGKSKGAYYVALEYVRGDLGSEKLRARRPMDYAQGMTYFAGLADGLRALHQAKITHGWIDAKTVMFGKDSASLLEPGIPFDRDELESSWTRMMNVYTAPEVLDGQAPTMASDIFSLGCVMYHMFAGSAPFRGDTPAEALERMRAGVPSVLKHNRRVPQETAAALEKMMALDPGDRFADSPEMMRTVSKLPMEIGTQVAVNYAAVLGDAAAVPPKDPQSTRRPGPVSGRSPQAESGRSPKGESGRAPAAKKKKAKKAQSYSELVAEMTQRVNVADMVEKKGERTSLADLAMKGGRSHRAMAKARDRSIPPWFYKMLGGIGVVILLAGAAFGVMVWQDKVKRDKEKAERLAAASSAAVSRKAEEAKMAEKIKEHEGSRDQKRFDACKKLYDDSLASLSELQLTDKELRPKLEIIRDRLRECTTSARVKPTWPGIANAYHLMGRVQVYWAYSDTAGDVEHSVKKDHLQNGIAALRQATRYLKLAQKDTSILYKFDLNPPRWSPERSGLAKEWVSAAVLRGPRLSKLTYDNPAQAIADIEHFSKRANKMARGED